MTAHQRRVLQIAHAVPEALSLATQSDILQHACHRKVATLQWHEDIDVVIADSSRPEYWHKSGFDQSIPFLISTRQYRTEYNQDGLIVLVRNGVTFSVPQ
jgi:hypothetical protein